MKLIAIFVALANALLFFSPAAYAQTVSYPFDSITITSAYMFEVACDEVPHADSYLNGMVEEGESFFVYVGTLVFSSGSFTSESSMVIVTNEDDEDICKWIINSYSSVPGVKETITFSSHITVDPLIGVVKNLNGIIYSAIVERTASNVCTFTASGDNFSQAFDMVSGTYAEETALNIIISAYGGI